MSLTWVRTHGARAAVLALSAPVFAAALLTAPAASAGHPMTPASETESQVDFFADYADYSADATPPLPSCAHSIPIHCFGADTIRAAYRIQPVLDQGISGQGSTIVIIDAFQNPSLATDVARFDRFWGLPALKLTKYAPFGVPAFDPNSKAQVSFSREISIDVEWAHAVAPGASIVLVEASSEKDSDLVAATQYAVDNNLGDVITQSFGEAEKCASPEVIAQQHAVFQKASALGITVFASSGDRGAARQACDGNGVVFSASTPASDPEVTGVGGTHLLAGAGGAYLSESGWNSAPGASGGGFSTLYRRPGYQAPFQENNKARGVPDVAYNADPSTGFIFVWMGMGGVIGGTSAGSPQWAGIVALANEAGGHRLGSINKTIYHLGKSDGYSSAFHDITSGNNSFAGIDGFAAQPGWDPFTGLGSPDVANLIPVLIGPSGL